MLNRRRFVASLAAAPLAAFGGLSAAAAEWPQRPVRILYPYAAGSSGDITARVIARRLSDGLGQPFVIENRAGANGIVATAAVARAPADGHTLLWAITPQIAIAPAMAKVTYDPLRDFAPISAVCSNSFALAVNPRFDAAQSLYRRFSDGAVAVPFSLFPQNPWRWMAAGALPE